MLEPRRVLATLSGSVYEDVNDNQVMDVSDPRLPGTIVFLDANENGILDRRGFGIDPDEFAPGHVLNKARPTVFLSATADDDQPAFRVLARDELARATTGQRVFGMENTTDWGRDRRLRFDFASPVDSASLDVVGSSAVSNPDVVLEAYDIAGQLIDSQAINDLGNGHFATLVIARTQKDISYVVARVTSVVGTVKYDNLRADDTGSERATYTSDSGFYRFVDVPAGLVSIAQVTPAGYNQTDPVEGHRLEVTQGAVHTNLNFGNRTSQIGGIVFEDLGDPGPFHPQTDRAIEGAGVYLDINQSGTPDVNEIEVMPNDFLEGQVLDVTSRFFSLTAVNSVNQATGEKVVADFDATTSPDALLFTHEGNPAWSINRRLRADINGLASGVQLTFVGATETPEVGRLAAYSATGKELAAVETGALRTGDSETLEIHRDGFDIRYAVAYTSVPANGTSGSVRLTDLQSFVVSEPLAITNHFGEYQFKPVASGSYQVRALRPGDLDTSFPADQSQQVSVETGDVRDEVDFGFHPVNQPPVARNDFNGDIRGLCRGHWSPGQRPRSRWCHQSTKRRNYPASTTWYRGSHGFWIYQLYAQPRFPRTRLFVVHHGRRPGCGFELCRCDDSSQS